MRDFCAKLTPLRFTLLALPALGLAYPVVMILIPALVRAAVPDMVRALLSLI